ncbi:hypothetical protein ACGFWD_10035 [Streptomyces sp. NPDC048448]|uniref:hypothetical protein n=1 Tax=unclassified Streptomyces TaxID=2593676 RepID=UPI00143EDC30|nr:MULTISPECIES: hypothetical protein [unclassified Streptomyces]QIY64011.1 hypothetical protein HEP85_23370 [Streptomyces sp. RPA4-2]
MYLSRSVKMAMLTVAPLMLVATGFDASASAGQDPRPGAAAFSLSALSSDSLSDVSGVSAKSAVGRTLQAQGFGVLRAASGETAVVDTSLAREGITSAAGKDFVTLSWKGYEKGARYVITRDGRNVAALAAGVTSFRDTHVKPGAGYHYQVVPVLPEGGAPQARLYGVRVSVPASGSLTGLRAQAAERATAAAVARTSTVTWLGFIPQKKVNAPPAGCDYGTNYQFGGDGHSDFNWKSDKYRFALNATVTWNTKKVVANKHIQASHVYLKRTGRLVAQKTASARNTYAKKLGSSSRSVDVRMVVHATNPFCRGLGGVKGAADGALTMNLATSGNYAIRSGKHRLYPNTYIYIYDGGRVTDVVTRRYASTACLIGSVACPEADLTGYYGRF